MIGALFLLLGCFVQPGCHGVDSVLLYLLFYVLLLSLTILFFSNEKKEVDQNNMGAGKELGEAGR